MLHTRFFEKNTYNDKVQLNLAADWAQNPPAAGYLAVAGVSIHIKTLKVAPNSKSSCYAHDHV